MKLYVCIRADHAYMHDSNGEELEYVVWPRGSVCAINLEKESPPNTKYWAPLFPSLEEDVLYE